MQRKESKFSDWWPTADEASADFERRKVELTTGPGSALFKITLYMDGQVEDDAFIVRTIPNRL